MLRAYGILDREMSLDDHRRRVVDMVTDEVGACWIWRNREDVLTPPEDYYAVIIKLSEDQVLYIKYNLTFYVISDDYFTICQGRDHYWHRVTRAEHA